MATQHARTKAPKGAKTATQPKTGRKAAKGKTPAPPASAPGSKQTQLIVLLQQAHGTTIAEAACALGWQPHSVRGMLSGVIKKKLKLAVEKFAMDGATRYRVAG